MSRSRWDALPIRYLRVTTESDCAECGEPIDPGDMTVLRSDDTYAHASHYWGRTLIRWEYQPDG